MFSPMFTTPQSPALSQLMPPPSLPPPSLQPPSLPPPLTNERPNETPPHHSSGLSHSTDRLLHHHMAGHNGAHHSDVKPNVSGLMSSSQNPLSLHPSLSYSGSYLSLPSFAPPSVQGPGTPGIPSVTDSHLQPTLQ
jgi:hypothetical protein